MEDGCTQSIKESAANLVVLVGGEASQGWRITLSEGGNAAHGHRLTFRLQDQDAQRDTQWEALVCELEQMLVVPGKQIPFLWLGDPAPQSDDPGPLSAVGKLVFSCEAGEPWTGKWPWHCYQAVPASQSSLCSQPCQHRLVCSSELSKVTTNEFLQNCCYFLSPSHFSLHLQSFWVTHCQRMLFWLSCMFIFFLSAVDKRLPQTLRCPRLCHFSGRLFPTLQGHPVLFKLLSWRSTWSPLSQWAVSRIAAAENEPLSGSRSPLPAPDGNGFPSAKYSSGHYPRWCHFCGVPIFHTLAGKQTTRQFTAQALAGCHSSVFLPPCIKFNLQNLVFPPGTSPSHSCVWDRTLLSCWWCANSFSASCLSAFGVHHTWRRAGVCHGAWWMWWRIREKRIREKRSHSPRSQPPSSACPALFLHPPSLYPHIQAGFIHQFPC